MLLYARDLGCKILLNGSGGDSIIGSGMEVFQSAFEAKNWVLLKELLAKRVPFFNSESFPGWESFSYDKRLFLVKQFYYYNRIARTGRSTPYAFAKAYFELAKNLDVSHLFMLKRGVTSFLNRRNKPNVNGQLTLAKDEHLALTDSGPKFSSSRSLLGDLDSVKYGELFDDVFNPMVSWSAENLFDLGNHYGISSRSPMKNKALFELCMSIPDSMKFGEGRGREHFRAAMKNLLPAEVYNRTTKATLSSQYGQDMTLRLWKQAEESVMDSTRLWDFIDRKKLLHEVVILNNPNISYNQKTKTWLHITRAVTLSSWLDWLSGNK
jgi:asparagine synthase (glutamine-hydrolysing)